MWMVSKSTKHNLNNPEIHQKYYKYVDVVQKHFGLAQTSRRAMLSRLQGISVSVDRNH